MDAQGAQWAVWKAAASSGLGASGEVEAQKFERLTLAPSHSFDTNERASRQPRHGSTDDSPHRNASDASLQGRFARAAGCGQR